MRRYVQGILGLGLIAGLSVSANAQGTGSVYPPADGNFYFNPPLFAAPGAFGSQYLELFPAYPGYSSAPNGESAVEAEAEGDFGANQANTRTTAKTAAKAAKATVKGKAARAQNKPLVNQAPMIVGAAAGIRPRNPRAAARAASNYNRGYNQAPVPYASQLPQGQLVWPGGGLVPGYAPVNRYQSYGEAYGKGPYGSGFYSGYWHGMPISAD